MKKYTKEDLASIIKAHGKWWRGEAGGTRADLTGADLTSANLYGADLSGADLTGADLTSANLSGADLTGADLTSANLYGANLSGADLTGAYLSRADLSGADLTGADLTSANLSSANLSSADLTGAAHAWAQVAFKGHGECGRMLTALIYKDGDAPVYQCGCFSGSLGELKAYIKGGKDEWKKSRTLAMVTVTKLLAI